MEARTVSRNTPKLRSNQAQQRKGQEIPQENTSL